MPTCRSGAEFVVHLSAPPGSPWSSPPLAAAVPMPNIVARIGSHRPRYRTAGKQWTAVGKAEVDHGRRSSLSCFAERAPHRLMCQPPWRDLSGPDQLGSRRLICGQSIPRSPPFAYLVLPMLFRFSPHHDNGSQPASTTAWLPVGLLWKPVSPWTY
jgi:hypothetical protein